MKELILTEEEKQLSWENYKYWARTDLDKANIYTELQWNKRGFKIKKDAPGKRLWVSHKSRYQNQYYLPSEVTKMTEKQMQQLQEKQRKERRRKEKAQMKQLKKDLAYYKQLSSERCEEIDDLNYTIRTNNYRIKNLESENNSLQRFKVAYKNIIQKTLQQIDDESVKDIEFIVLDTETTGLSANYHEILQLSIIDNNGNVLFDEYFNAYAENWDEAQSVNGISPDMVRSKPYFYERLHEIQQILSRASLAVYYNAAFDSGFLKANGLILPPSYCVMEEFAEIYGEYSEYWGNYTWQTLGTCSDYYGFNWDNLHAHNSLVDSFATLYSYLNILERTEKATEIQTKVNIIAENTIDNNQYSSKKKFDEEDDDLPF